MGADTGHLQRLTDGQVNARLQAYNPDGSLERDLKGLWQDAGDIIDAEVRAQFGGEAAERVHAHYSGKVDSTWVQNVAEYGRRIYRDKTSVPAYIVSRDQLISRVTERMFERFANESATLQRCITSFQRLTSFETDIILAQVSLLEAIEAADLRGRDSEQFELRVAELVRASTDQSKQLTERTRSTAASARGMLGKTSEVAAAAEQSAVAMREAAQTAAGLIRAIEDARSEVEVAAGVATRAGDQASQAVKVSQALSAHVEAIESIDHRGSARRRCRPRLRGGCAGSEEPRIADGARDRRHHQQDHRDPAGDEADRRGQWLDPGHGRGSAKLGRPHPPGDGAPGSDGDDDHCGSRRDGACRRLDELDHRRHPHRHRKRRSGH